FKELILKSIFEVDDVKDVPEFVLSEEDWENIHKISKERCQNWEWNYGTSPAYNVKASHKFPSGLLDVRLDIKKRIIDNCIIYGDFFGLGDVKEVEERLIGVRHDKQAVTESLKDIDVPYYLGKITN